MARNFPCSCVLHSTGHSQNVSCPFLAPTLALRGTHSCARCPHEETEAGEVAGPGTVVGRRHSASKRLPTSPLWSPGLNALSPEIIRRERADLSISTGLPGRERRKGTFSYFIPGPATWCLMWALQKPHEAGTMIPRSQERTPSQAHNVYVPGGTRTDKYEAGPKSSPAPFAANTLWLPRNPGPELRGGLTTWLTGQG